MSILIKSGHLSRPNLLYMYLAIESGDQAWKYVDNTVSCDVGDSPQLPFLCSLSNRLLVTAFPSLPNYSQVASQLPSLNISILSELGGGRGEQVDRNIGPGHPLVTPWSPGHGTGAPIRGERGFNSDHYEK